MIQIYHNIGELLTLQAAAKKDGRRVTEQDLSAINNALLVVKSGKILWAGSKSEFSLALKKELIGKRAHKKINLKGSDVLPAFTECHTHSVFAGDRQAEFEKRNQGVTYAEIAKQGGGILSTVDATRRASEKELLKLAQARVQNFIQQGVTTVEVKSGYGLNQATEKKILKVANQLKKARVVPTFLGPHAVPPEFSSSSEFVDEVIKWLPSMKKLAKRVDMFVEEGYFSLADAKKFYQAALEQGFLITGHTDQLSSTSSSITLAEMKALSVDHAVNLTEQEVSQMGSMQTTAVLLPAADFYIHVPYPPARALIDAGARVALATDFNPGSSPTQDLSFVGVLARLQMKMTLAEVICAYTYNASAALGLSEEIGSIEVGKSADFVVLSDSWRHLFYEVGSHPVLETYKSGKKIS